MATLKSLYSAAVQANVPTDLLAPGAPELGTINAQQSVSGEPKGKTQVTLNWTPPTTNEPIAGELLGTATGAAQDLETQFDPIEAASYTVYERTGKTGGSTTLNGSAKDDEKIITVTATTNFAVGDWIVIEDGVSGKEEYCKIAAINGNDFELEANLYYDHADAVAVEEVQVSTKVETTDYTVVLSTGIVSLVSGQFTNGNKVFIGYLTTLQDLAGYTLLRIPGNATIADPIYSKVNADPNKVVVSDAIGAGASQYQETLTEVENGETWTYYLYAKDDETSPNRSPREVNDKHLVMVETIPGIPQNPTKTTGDRKVLLAWDDAQSGGANPNLNGYNVYRCLTSWNPANAVKVNSTLLVTPTFNDSSLNVTNRRPSGEVPYPANGETYYYKIESQDTTTAWTTGTQNQSSDPSQSDVLVAAKTA